MRSDRAAALAGLAAGAALLLGAGPASALSVTLESPVGGAEPPVVEITDDSSDANTVTVAVAGDRLNVTDTTAGMVRALTGCDEPAGPASNTISCPLPGKVRINLLERDDTVTVAPGVPAPTVFGGAGNDTLTGGSRMFGQVGDDTLTGTDGLDVLDGGIGADSVNAGAGNDTIIEGKGLEPDTLDAGAGDDILVFRRPTDVTADLTTAGQTASSPGETNTVAGFERLVGGDGNDTLRVAVPLPAGDPVVVVLGRRGNDRLLLGGPASGLLRGGRGADVLSGGAGDDRLDGEGGKDRLTGGGGADALYGGPSADRLSGGTGADLLAPGLGGDTASGGSGADRFVARDTQRDRLDGGPGSDRASVDRIDRVRKIERVKRRA